MHPDQVTLVNYLNQVLSPQFRIAYEDNHPVLQYSTGQSQILKTQWQTVGRVVFNINDTHFTVLEINDPFIEYYPELQQAVSMLDIRYRVLASMDLR